MHRIAKLITDFFIYKGAIAEDERDIYEYGFDITIYTILSTFGLLLIGLLCGQFLESVALVAIFYTCQSVGGGYHATTHYRCFFVMCAGLLVGLGFGMLLRSPWILGILSLFAIVTLFTIPLTLHPNKKYLLSKKCELVRKSRIVTLVSVAIAIIIGMMQWIRIAILVVGFFLSAISRIVAQNKYNEKTEND